MDLATYQMIVELVFAAVLLGALVRFRLDWGTDRPGHEIVMRLNRAATIAIFVWTARFLPETISGIAEVGGRVTSESEGFAVTALFFLAMFGLLEWMLTTPRRTTVTAGSDVTPSRSEETARVTLPVGFTRRTGRAS